MNNWKLLITSLPTENATVRMRVWRSLKAYGAAVLRDGVYLLPELTPCSETLMASLMKCRRVAAQHWCCELKNQRMESSSVYLNAVVRLA